MKKLFSFITIVFLIFSVHIKVSAFQITDNQTVDANKIWTIKFTDAVGFDDLTKQGITVTDSKGNAANITIIQGLDDKTILVNPPQGGYTLGESYALTVNTMVHSSKGKNMKKERVVHFYIKNEETTNINSYDDLYLALKEGKKNLKINDSKILAAYNNAENIIKSSINGNMSELEKEKFLHDYVVKNTKYDYENFINNTVPDDSYTPYGILVKKIGVCQGYAETMTLLLNMAGIECTTVVGKSQNQNHAWNKVKIDNNYYNLDTTWDDPAPDKGSDYVRYDYFNVSDEQLSKDHNWDINIVVDGKNITCDYRYYHNCQINNINPTTKRSINGTVSLPDGEIAPKGGVYIHISAESDSKTPGDVIDDLKFEKSVIIPEGKSSVNYSIDVWQNINGYTINYQVYFKDSQTEYIPNGFYTTNGSSPTMIDFSENESAIANIKILKANNLIKGKISLNGEEKAPSGGLKIMLCVIPYSDLPVLLHGGGSVSITNSKTIIIPEGQSSIDYSINITANSLGYVLQYFVYAQGYINPNFYRDNNGEVSKVSCDDLSSKDIVLVKGE